MLDIAEKFSELQWLERERFSQGILNGADSHEWAQDTDPNVKLRNRYFNIQPWAKNRIHLRVPPGCCDYINASPIVLRSAGGSKENKYIATQGPKEGLVSHLW